MACSSITVTQFSTPLGKQEQKLIEKLRLIEALISGATIQGEKVAAELAREWILERLRRMEKEESLIEYRISMADMWARKVFVALLIHNAIILLPLPEVLELQEYQPDHSGFP